MLWYDDHMVFFEVSLEFDDDQIINVVRKIQLFDDEVEILLLM